MIKERALWLIHDDHVESCFQSKRKLHKLRGHQIWNLIPGNINSAPSLEKENLFFKKETKKWKKRNMSIICKLFV